MLSFSYNGSIEIDISVKYRSAFICVNSLSTVGSIEFFLNIGQLSFVLSSDTEVELVVLVVVVDVEEDDADVFVGRRWDESLNSVCCFDHCTKSSNRTGHASFGS